MSQFLISESVGSILRILGDALEFIDVGILLLDRDMRALYVNRQLSEMFAFSPGLLASAPHFRNLFGNAAAQSMFLMPEGE
jgi:PAS domain-containing protein